jgi:O-antigen/teichoic acid export membrane protein
MSGPVPWPALRSVARNKLVRVVLANCSARVLAILGLAAATVAVARVGGPADVGGYALLRMLPGLVGVLSVGGLPGAMGYFLAEPRRHTPGLWPTLFGIEVGGSLLGVLVWLAASPLLASTFFPGDSVAVIAWASVTVASQLVLTVGKTALQGLQDRRGGDLVIAAEELAFLPCYLAAVLLGMGGMAAIVVGLALADLLVAVEAWRRVARQVGWRRGVRIDRRACVPRRDLTREVLTYGIRGQVGGMISLLNLRLDFAVLGAMAGPAVLGAYAVASKYAELLRLPGTALTWVCYPMLAGMPDDEASRLSRRLIPATLAANVVAAVPFVLLAGPVIGLLYGSRFDAAVGPAQVLVAGMLLAGAAGVGSGYLYGRGRPGLNSWALGLGLVVTVILDVLLIPSYGATGAAVASTTTYLLADGALVLLLLRLSDHRRRRQPAVPDAVEVPT